MSHSLHRRGNPEELKNDYVVLITSRKGVNSENALPKIREIVDKVWEIGPSNAGSNQTGSMLSGVTPELVKANMETIPRVRAYFYGKEKVWQIVDFVREQDYGYSVVLQGPREIIEQDAREKGIVPHSVNLSLDVWGRRDLLPDENVMEFVTMCGHGLIAASLVEKVFEDVKAGRTSPEAAVKKLAAPCVCGFFSPERALKILTDMAPKSEEGAP